MEETFEKLIEPNKNLPTACHSREETERSKQLLNCEFPHVKEMNAFLLYH